MFRKFVFGLLLALLWGLPLSAQSSTLVAFQNAAGQLVVASADGTVRWIVTNPGEQLHNTLGFSWSPDGQQLFYAVQQGNQVSLRLGAVRRQTTQEYLQLADGFLTGGGWRDNAPLVSDGNAVYQGATPISADQALFTPYTDPLPQQPAPLNAAPSGDVLAWRDGSYVLNDSTFLTGTADYDQRAFGLWAGDLLAYGGFDPQTGSGTVYVVHVPTQNIISLSSGRALPIYPEQWLTNTTLLYRDASGNVRVAEVGCLAAGCDANPLENGTLIIGAGAQQIQRSGSTLLYQEDTTLKAVSLACVASDDCLNQTQIIAENLNPEGIMQVRAQRVVYSAYQQNAFDLRDYTVYTLPTECLTCGGVPLVNGAINGLLTPNGDYVVVAISGDGIYSVNTQNGQAVYLTDAGIPLTQIRWQE
jgi:hypothetical protein